MQLDSLYGNYDNDQRPLATITIAAMVNAGLKTLLGLEAW